MDIDQIIAEVRPFNQVDDIEPGVKQCAYARDFTQCLANRLDPLDDTLTHPEIAYKLYLLQESYHEYRSYVPKSHRDYTGPKHSCVYSVYLDHYARLKLLALRLPVANPFTLSQRETSSRRSAPPQQIAGIVIGEGG